MTEVGVCLGEGRSAPTFQRVVDALLCLRVFLWGSMTFFSLVARLLYGHVYTTSLDERTLGMRWERGTILLWIQKMLMWSHTASLLVF